MNKFQQQEQKIEDINVALAAEQKISSDRLMAYERANETLERVERDYKICCTMRDSHSKQLEVVLPRLLSALAVLEDVALHSVDGLAAVVCKRALTKIKEGNE